MRYKKSGIINNRGCVFIRYLRLQYFLFKLVFISIIVSLNFNFNTYPAFDQLGFVNFLSCFEVDRIYVAFHEFSKILCLLWQLISPVYLLYPLICTRSIESGLVTYKNPIFRRCFKILFLQKTAPL